jgi:hypothetical protein
VLVACGDATTLVAVRPTGSHASGACSSSSSSGRPVIGSLALTPEHLVPMYTGVMKVYGWGSTTNRGSSSSTQQQQQRTSRSENTSSAMPSFFRAKGKVRAPQPQPQVQPHRHKPLHTERRFD